MVTSFTVLSGAGVTHFVPGLRFQENCTFNIHFDMFWTTTKNTKKIHEIDVYEFVSMFNLPLFTEKK